MWLPVDGSDDPKIPSGKGKWLIALHAGNREEGLIDRCDLVFLANPGLIQIYNFIPILSKLPDFSEVITPTIYY
jgi:hypothetical protein